MLRTQLAHPPYLFPFFYFAAAFFWLLLMDRWILRFHLSPQQEFLLWTVKDGLFIIVTAFLLYKLLAQQKRMETATEEKERLEKVFESVPDLLIYKDSDGKWMEASEFGREVFGLSQVEFKGKSDEEFLEMDPFYQKTFLKCMKMDNQAWSQQKTVRYQESIPRKNGGAYILDILKAPMYHSNGKPKGILVIGRDITDIKRAEEVLVSSEKLVVAGELAAGIAHEIRNPLTVLKGFVQLLREKAIDIEACDEMIMKELDRINMIVSELLTLAKPVKAELEQQPINQHIKDVIQLLGTEANLQNITLTHTENESPLITCSGNQVKQVLINIIKNGIEAIEGSGSVAVSVFTLNNTTAVVQVRDTGSGIEPDRIKRIGEPFFSAKEKGIGLGMTMCYKIMAEHGGDIHISSTVGAGTTVELHFPLAERPAVNLAK